MISISVITDQVSQVRQLLRDNNLEEQVFITNYSLVQQPSLSVVSNNDKSSIASNGICIRNNEITIEPNWSMHMPPVLFPVSIPFSKYNLLAIVHLFLGDEQASLDLASKNKELEKAVLTFTALKHQLPITLNTEEADKGYEIHNLSLLSHYGLLNERLDFNGIRKMYLVAIDLSEGKQRQAFTKYFYSLFLIDAGYVNEAIEVLEQVLKQHLNKQQALILKYQYADALLLSDKREESLGELKPLIKELLELSRGLLDEHQEAMVWQLASDVAEMEENYMEAIACLQKALNYFIKHQYDLLAANVQYKKGEMLLNWSHKGNPSMYGKAAECYREAVKVFTKEATPEIFARVHHKLGMIYADMPFQKEKRSMIAALSVTSFNEALQFFSKEKFPYEFAAIHQDFGNAYLKYPDSLLNDNYSKAIQHYQEALAIRTKEAYPLERSITLLNYLETLWLLPQEDRLSESLLDEMQAMANEVVEMDKDKGLTQEAQRHLTDIEKLKIELKNA